MKQNERKVNSIRNSIIEIIVYIATIILNLITRIVLIRYIGVEFLGLNGLFTSILSVLAISELGFSSVMWYFLYEPVAKKDIEKIKSIVGLAKKVYTAIFGIIIIASLALLPFLQFFIDSTISIDKIRIYFILFSLASAVSYLITYKSVLLGAEQKDYIDKLFTLISSIVNTALQLVVLVVFKSFILFLIIKIATTLLRNFVLNIFINKQYPYLKENNANKLTKQEKQDIVKKTSAHFFHKIGSVVSNSIDNILISAFLTIAIVGYYSNYSLIFVSVAALLTKTINGSCASVGNLWVSSDKGKVEEVFNKVFFLEYWITAFCACAIFVLSEDFIRIVFGSSFTLGQNIVLLLTAVFYLSKINLTAGVFKDANGLFWHDRFRPLIEAAINIIASVIFVKLFGLAGVLLGTICSYALTIWVEPLILYKHGFNKSCNKYLIKNIVLAGLCVGVISVTYLLCSLFGNSVFDFIIKIAICCIVPNLIFICCFFKNKNFKFYRNWIFSKFRFKKHKKD